MRATEIIRNILDLIDQIDGENEPTAIVSVTAPQDIIQTGIDSNRFKHIFSMLSAEQNADKMYSNSPTEVIAPPESVSVDAGGGLNGPKNPADLRAANSFSMFPNFQAKG